MADFSITRKSQASAKEKPAPAAGPLMAATTGFFIRLISKTAPYHYRATTWKETYAFFEKFHRPFQVPTGAERLSRASDQHATCRVVFGQLDKAHRQLGHHFKIQCVVLLRTI